jgi:hypothetical protein
VQGLEVQKGYISGGISSHLFSLHMVPARSCTSSSICPAHQAVIVTDICLTLCPPLPSQPLLSVPLLFVSPPRLLDYPIMDALSCELDSHASDIDALTSHSVSNRHPIWMQCHATVRGMVCVPCIHAQCDGVFRCACHAPMLCDGVA